MEKLGINTTSLLFQLINFGILFFILKKFLYGTIQKTLHDRKRKIDQSLEDAKTIEKRLSDVEETIKEKLAKASNHSDQILVEAKKIAKDLQAQMKQDAQSEAQQIVTRAQASLAAQEDHMMRQLESKIITLAQTATEKILQEYLSTAEREKITAAALKKISQK